MNKLIKVACCFILPVVLLSFTACSGSGGAGSLAVVSASMSVAQGPGDTQVISYSATLENKSANRLFIEMMEPVPSSGLEPKVLADNLTRAVSKYLSTGQTVDVNGSFAFDAKGMTKADIDKLQPFVTGFQVTYEETLPVPGK